MSTEATTTEQLETLLHSSLLLVDFGAELLDANDQCIEDISGELEEAGYVDHNNYGTVHGKCQLVFPREFTWASDRIRPYITCDNGTYYKRWNLGVYLITAPQTRLSEVPVRREVMGQDKISLLARPIGDSYYVASGTGYLDAVRQVITDSEVTGLSPQLDGSAEATTLSANMVWLLDPSRPPTFLGVANDLLAAVNYRGLYSTRDGAYASEPWQSPSLRTPTWTFDVTDEERQMVAEDRVLSEDEEDKTNYFVFVRSGMTYEPTDGDGLYIVDNSGTGVKYKRTWWPSVEGQTELEAEGDKKVEEIAQRKRTIKFPASPSGLLWHFDVLNYSDLAAGGYLKGQAMNWHLPLDRSDMTVQMEVLS